MTLGAYFYPDLFFGGTRSKCIAAGTAYSAFNIFRMNIFFHLGLSRNGDRPHFFCWGRSFLVLSLRKKWGLSPFLFQIFLAFCIASCYTSYWPKDIRYQPVEWRRWSPPGSRNFKHESPSGYKLENPRALAKGSCQMQNPTLDISCNTIANAVN